ncbi:MAG: DNA polymerase I [Erysipelotrichaceae bacterium]|nr:DNA polymerase I [Erysipelotrichaceae bacterium]MDD3924631.1 DNA polymerase I [Erysipelotrichaceae bacterium]
MKKLLLIDGNSLVFRAYYATAYGRMMTTSNNISTNAVYGFATMINKALDLVQPDALLVAFDTDKKTFRHEIFKEYKGTRKAAPPELIVQFPIVREYLDAMNIRWFELAGMEADDIIGTISRKYPHYQTNILTSDRDLLQLIDDTTSVWLMKKGLSEIEKVTSERLNEMIGLSPKQIIDLKALMGDSSDNIPGVPNVGEKTALKLLAEFENVENVLANTDKIKGKLKERLEDNRELALLSKTLATINCDISIDISVDELKYELDVDKLYAFYLKYEMNSFLKNLDMTDRKPQDDQTNINYQKVTKIPHDIFVDDVALYFDYDHKDQNLAKICGIAIAYDDKQYYIDINDVHNDIGFIDFLASDKSKIVYDSKFIYHLLKHNDLVVNNIGFDVCLGAFIVDNFINDWDKLYNKYALHTNDKVNMIYDHKTKTVDKQLQISHAIERVTDINNIAKKLKKDIKDMDLNYLYYDVELPLTKILFDMEEKGIKIDNRVLDDIASKTLSKLDQLSESIYKEVGVEFNINSPKQLAEILFDRLELPMIKKRSTAIDVLERLQNRHPIINNLMSYRKYQKLFSTYAEGLKKYVNDDGRIHTIYNQTITQTGRLSSTDPNLQNITIRDEESKEIRKAFIADKGCVLLAADYSQIELRILAHMANEDKLIKTFVNEEDIHTSTACEVFNVKAEDVTATMRRQAKAVNFGIVYGISDYGLSQQLMIDNKTAQGYIDRYFSSYPKIKDFMEEVIHYCQENGYVKTLLNRRRYIPEINDKNYMTREFGKRAAMNAPIQGSAADLIKLAMVNIDKRIQKERLRSKMILQVHDELIFNVCEDEIKVMKELIETEMENAMKLNVPLEAKCVQGDNWYDAK